jgi:hypothetical protein
LAGKGDYEKGEKLKNTAEGMKRVIKVKNSTSDSAKEVRTRALSVPTGAYALKYTKPLHQEPSTRVAHASSEYLRTLQSNTPFGLPVVFQTRVAYPRDIDSPGPLLSK